METIVLVWIVLACTGFFCVACTGFFCVGYLFGNRKVLYWRIKWIECEYDFCQVARSQAADHF